MKRWWRDPAIRVRVTATAVLVSGLFAVVLYALVMLLVRWQTAYTVQDRLEHAGRRVAGTVREGRLAPLIVTGEGELIQVVDAAHRVVASTRRMAGRGPVDFPEPGPRDDRRTGRACHLDAPGGGCHLVVVYRVGEGPFRRNVYTLAPAPGWVPRPLLGAALGLMVPGIAWAVGYGTWRSAGRTLRPVEAIRAELDEITATDLERRVPSPPRRDEIARLAESVNATLDRLEHAVARLRGFVSDVSHELRSPLTGLRTELELALSDPDAPDLRETLDAVLRNAERLQSVLDDVLALARLESQQEAANEPVELGELADQEVLRRPRRTRVHVESDEPVVVRGGRAELGRLLSNLIDNADGHAESTVVVTVRADGDEAVMEVYDDGPGMPREDRERLFERFSRLSAGRHRDAGGTWLGLSISRDIAAAHGGSLDVTDRPDGEPGIRFLLRLPR
ncbi:MULTISPECIES: sensor histidine kinase [Actinomadura]|uniref:histidine kinase n=1 Tax=Actinomadura yumaensis TaxID=111807 RepID=A0ABW2C9T0_9ACTN|nr:HAMP domain-containing sensor histidine kinase [Actinomadura sp. J1-007]